MNQFEGFFPVVSGDGSVCSFFVVARLLADGWMDLNAKGGFVQSNAMQQDDEEVGGGVLFVTYYELDLIEGKVLARGGLKDKIDTN